MVRFGAFVPAIAGLVAASVTVYDGATYTLVPTADALPLDDLRTLSPPTFTSQAGRESDISSYATATAIAAVVADQNEDPLTAYPAVTAVPINAAGEDDDGLVISSTATLARRAIERRSACDAQATISNYYGVNVASYSAFKADPTIASVANAAPTPAGYTQNFRNMGGSSNGIGYLGYAVVNKGQTGYDVDWCAKKCNSINGCLSFNIYFERAPTQEPGNACPNPPAFANIKCSFWGTGLSAATAKENTGQWQAQFRLGVAGSNGYTSWKVGGPIADYGTPQSLNISAINSPERDCSGSLTYMGFKLLQDGPFDPRLCAAACDTQTAYNLQHPPSVGKPAKCAAFGTYILTLTNKTGDYQLGQMCTLYTSFWDKAYAKNTVSYDDRIGAKYTYSYSFFYSRQDQQPICKSDISSLQADGAAFCTSYLGYVPPVTTTTTTATPATSVITSTQIEQHYTTVTPVGTQQWKRDITARDIATPANVVGWPATRISEACSQVATGTSTSTSVTVAPTPVTTTTLATTSTSTSLLTCAVPTRVAEYQAFTPVWGSWDGDRVGVNTELTHHAESWVDLPFAIGLGNSLSKRVLVASNGFVAVGIGYQLNAFAFQGGVLALYPGKNGVFYRVAGPVGSRSVTFSWFAGTTDYDFQQNHFTITFFEDRPNYAQMKYYNVVMDPNPGAHVYFFSGKPSTYFIPTGQHIPNGTQIEVYVPNTDDVQSRITTHDRVDCCTVNSDWYGGWNTCTEYQAPRLGSLAPPSNAAQPL